MQIPTNKFPLIMGIINMTPDSFYPKSRIDSNNISDNL